MNPAMRAGVVVATCLLALTGCGTPGGDATSSTPPPAPTSTGAPVATPPASAAPTSASPSSTASEGPVETFHTWLKASRVPDPALACSLLSDQLIKRMLAEMKSAKITSCAQLTTQTAAIYKALNQSAEVEVKVLSQTPSKATLFVTYVDGASCGEVVLEKRSTWIITEQSKQTC